MSLSTEELMVRGRAAELDPNTCRTHMLLAVLIHEVQSFIWGFGGGKGPKPVPPMDHIPWTRSWYDSEQDKEDAEADHSANVGNLLLMAARGE